MFSWREHLAWTDADSRALQAFLGTSTGRKLRQMVENETIAANERAVMGRGDVFASGCAAGFKGMWAFVWSFANFQAQPEESPASNNEVAAGLEHLQQ